MPILEEQSVEDDEDDNEVKQCSCGKYEMIDLSLYMYLGLYNTIITLQSASLRCVGLHILKLQASISIYLKHN